MTDPIDIAAEVQDRCNRAAIDAHLSRPPITPRDWCRDCYGPIPEPRRALGVERCIGCQQIAEVVR